MTTPHPTPAPSLTLIVHAGSYDRVHYALVLATAAAAIGRKVTLFFAGTAQATLFGTPEQPGWRVLTGAELDPAAEEKGIADFETLLEAAADLKIRIIACEMALKLAGKGLGDLRKGLTIEIAGAVTALEAARDGQILFV